MSVKKKTLNGITQPRIVGALSCPKYWCELIYFFDVVVSTMYFENDQTASDDAVFWAVKIGFTTWRYANLKNHFNYAPIISESFGVYSWSNNLSKPKLKLYLTNKNFEKNSLTTFFAVFPKSEEKLQTLGFSLRKSHESIWPFLLSFR